MEKAVIYARVSSEEQAKYGFSIGNQKISKDRKFKNLWLIAVKRKTISKLLLFGV